jgi:hypothetical protein
MCNCCITADIDRDIVIYTWQGIAGPIEAIAP